MDNKKELTKEWKEILKALKEGKNPVDTVEVKHGIKEIKPW